MTKKLLFAAFILLTSGAAYGQKTMTVKVFFHNEKLNHEMMDCTKAYPTTRRIPKTTGTAAAALNELFKGVTPEEAAKGFWALAPESTAGTLKSVRVSRGTAYVDFTKLAFEKLGNVTTSCGSGFFPMIENTLLQFATIKKVVYAVEGSTNDFYEWVQVGACPHGRHCKRSNFKNF